MAETPISPTKNLSFDQLAATRKSTQAVAGFLEKQLLGYLDTLRSLLLPERLLGKTVSQAAQAFASRQDRRGIDQLRQFVVNTLVMQALIARSAGLSSIFAELRYHITTQTHPGLSGLPLVVIQSRLPPLFLRNQ
jgi:hypothetical protein